MKRTIGFTSTIPTEIILAAGAIPVDLNNLFISSPNPYSMIEEAEAAGFPRNYCAWIKGIYGALASRPDIDTVIGVMQGDCGNTAALMDVIKNDGRQVIPFAYPSTRDPLLVGEAIKRLAADLAADMKEAEAERRKLLDVRQLAVTVDEMTWRDGLITGRENHLALIGMSDFEGDPVAYARSLSSLITEACQRIPATTGPRLSFIGVPPIASDLYELIISRGANVVYNEVQREFSMPRSSADLDEQYASYTYPYGAIARAKEIGEQAEIRQVDGIIHYVQSFCYHQLDDMVFRDALDLPILRLESDKPGPLDERSRLRLEAFIETLGG